MLNQIDLTLWVQHEVDGERSASHGEDFDKHVNSDEHSSRGHFLCLSYSQD